ncbi:Sodium Bile acid symporter family protein [Calycomorphotria hydatis]|uniref:Sodium Bile acid symporter family protein n=1 Tax=Calycomorphotria hydatis TaxID=2528027 RepID=A0A517TAY3_9PLAN|nr:Sodium Bile acid symporter family protein [Calycomorphotria hydatis]
MKRAVIILLLLIAAYFTAYFQPAAGLWLRAEAVAEMGPIQIRYGGVLLLLGFLLFSLGLKASIPRIEAAGKALAMFTGIRIVMLLILPLIALFFLAAGTSDLSILAALGIILTVPAAGSASGWIFQSRADPGIGSVLIAVTTLLCPIVTPFAISLAVSIMPLEVGPQWSSFAGEFGGESTLFWVCIPMLAGMGLHQLLGSERTEYLSVQLRTATVAALILLNYANAAQALPKFVDSAGLITILSVCGFAALQTTFLMWGPLFIGPAFRINTEQSHSIGLCAGMSNTGLALTVASIALPDAVVLQTTLIAYTLCQHISAAVYSNYWKRRSRGSANYQRLSGAEESNTMTPKPVSETSTSRPGMTTGEKIASSEAATVSPADSSAAV